MKRIQAFNSAIKIILTVLSPEAVDMCYHVFKILAQVFSFLDLARRSLSRASLGIILGLNFFGGAMANQAIVLIADPQVLAIPIKENHEPLVNVKKAGGLCIGPSPEIPNNQDYYYMRKTVYEKLMAAQKLLPPGLHFCLYESYRSLELQKMLFDKRLAKIKRLHPDWSYEQQFEDSTHLVSPVINLDGSKNIPPHSTGGAVDVYLVNEQGEAIDMGIHPKDWMLDKDGSISLTASTAISKEAQQNREIMSKVLNAVGFVNYPTEYWHWSYGDRYWAYVKKEANAVYGPAHK